MSSFSAEAYSPIYARNFFARPIADLMSRATRPALRLTARRNPATPSILNSWLDPAARRLHRGRRSLRLRHVFSFELVRIEDQADDQARRPFSHFSSSPHSYPTRFLFPYRPPRPHITFLSAARPSTAHWSSPHPQQARYPHSSKRSGLTYVALFPALSRPSVPPGSLPPWNPLSTPALLKLSAD